MLWAYYTAAEVGVVAGPEAVARYVRDDLKAEGEPSVAFCHCRTCGCTTHWEGLGANAGRTGVNARLFEPATLARAKIQRLDGADTWTTLD